MSLFDNIAVMLSCGKGLWILIAWPFFTEMWERVVGWRIAFGVVTKFVSWGKRGEICRLYKLLCNGSRSMR